MSKGDVNVLKKENFSVHLKTLDKVKVFDFEMQFDEEGKLIVPDNWVMTHTISYDEKPGIQAIANTSPDLRPNAKNGEVYRDHEYKRLGTVSLLACIDLNTGKAIPLVSDTHKSSDFVEFLKKLDREYPSQDTIRIILDNHYAHK